MPYNPISDTSAGQSSGYHPLGSAPTPPVSPLTPAPIKSPYFSAVDKTGSFGPSSRLDTSGKPYLDYRAPGDTATTTDLTRVDTNFDPRIAAPQSPKSFLTPRAVAGRAALKTAMGGSYSDELDHVIALELAGSNNKSNLQIEPDVPGTNNTATDPLENQLAKQVASGQMSLFDAQTKLAAAKGVQAPFTGVHHTWLDDVINGIKTGATDVGNFLGNAFGTKAEAAGYNPLPVKPQASYNPIQPNVSGTNNPLNLSVNTTTANSTAAIDQNAPTLEDLIYGNAKVRAPYAPVGSEMQTNFGVLPALGYNAVARIEELPVKVAAVLGANINAVKNAITGGNEDFKVPFDPTRIGLPAGNTISDSGERLIRRYSELQSQNPETPVWNGIQATVEGPIQDVFDVAFAGDIVQSEAAATLKQTGYSKETMSALRSMDVNPDEVKLLPPQEAKTMLASQASEKVNSILADYKPYIDAGLPLPKEATTQLQSFADGLNNIRQDVFNSPTSDINLNSFGKTMRQLADTLTKPVEGGADAAFKTLGDFSKQALPGERPIPGQAAPAGMSTQAVENVGGEYPEIPKDLQPLAEEARKYKSAEDFTAQQIRTQNRIVNNENSIESLQRQLSSTSPKDADVKAEIRQEISDLKNDNIKYRALGIEGKTKAELTDFYTKAVGEKTSQPINFTPDAKTAARINQIYRQLSRDSESLHIARSNPEAAAKAYGPARMKELETNIEKYKTELKKLNPSLLAPREVPKKPLSTAQEADKGTKALNKASTAASSSPAEQKLQELLTQHSVIKEMNLNDKAKGLIPYVESATGNLPEVTGKGIPRYYQVKKVDPASGKSISTGETRETNPSIYTREGDDIARNKFEYKNSNEAQKALDQYKENLAKERELRKEIAIKRREIAAERTKETREKNFNSLLSKQTIHPEEPNDDYQQMVKARKEEISKRLAVEQADAVTAFFEQNPDILEDFEDSGKLDEKMEEFVQEYLGNLSNFAQNDLNEEEAKLIEDTKEGNKERKLDAIVEEYRQKGIIVDRKILAENKGIVPPAARGGIRAPQFNVVDLKDVAMVLQSTDTLERNIEKIASPIVAKQLNDFYTEKIRSNEEASVLFKNAIRIAMEGKMTELGIKLDSPEDRAVQIFGEGRMSIAQLEAEFPKTSGKIQQADRHFREIFDRILPLWNDVRVRYGYKPVRPIGDRPYYRHFIAPNPWYGIFGSLINSYELPTEIAGLTDNFNPGKKWTSAELHRTGNKTQYSAMRSLDNYLDNVAPQIFHIDSIQRGRALEKYIRAAAKVNEGVKLPNFVANLHEHTNFVAGKNSRFDRAVESLAGRNLVKLSDDIRRVYGANVIGANFSSALTHFLPLSFNLATVDKIAAVRGLVDVLSSPFLQDFTKIDGIRSSFLTRRYPINFIQANKFQKITGALSTPFDIVDRFISRMAVSSKYYEGIKLGLSKEAAMTRADNYGSRIIGSRSIGDLPNAFKSKTLGFFTQFQIEVNDNLRVLIHDIPQWSKEDISKEQKATDMIEKTAKDGSKYYEPRGANYAKVLGMLVAFFITSHLVNHFLKKIKGNGKGLDLIQLGFDLAGYNDDGIPFFPQKNPDTPLSKRALSAGTDLLGELPLTNFLTGQIPASSAIPNPAAILSGNSTINHELLKPVINLTSPVGGGSQVNKTITGIRDYARGYETSASGKTQYPIAPGTGNAIREALFGSTSNPNITALQAKKNTFQPTYDKIRDLVLAGKKDAAATIYNALSDADKAEFKKIKASEAAKETNALKLKMKPVVDQVKNLVFSGDKEKAAEIYNALSDKEKKAFLSVKKSLLSQ